MTTLWEGTPQEKIFSAAISDPMGRTLLAMGYIHSVIIDAFGVDPISDNAPEEARATAHLMMQSSATDDPVERERLQAQALVMIGHWRKARAGVH